MEKKTYEVRFCNCGTVHFIDREFQERVWFKDEKFTGKQFVQVCTTCGATVISGLDDMGDHYDHYSFNADNHMEVDDDHVYEYDAMRQVLILSKGVRLRMMSGGYADQEWQGYFQDSEGLKRQMGDDFGFCYIREVNRNHPYSDDQMHNLRDIKALNVNMEQLLKEVTFDQAEAMCGYHIPSLNWKGTPHEKSFHN